MNQATVVSLHVGKIAPLGPYGEPSGFVKHAVHHPVEVTTLGLLGDQQADLSVHGGEEKAVYAYSCDHYAAWSSEYPQHSTLFMPGGVGENLAITGMVEADICMGDIHHIGSAQLQVCQPRPPCFKFALRFSDNQMPKAMVRNGRSGWYYRVLQTGVITPGDRVTLASRPNPNFPLTRLIALTSTGRVTPEDIRQMAVMPGLASSWQAIARDMLE